MDLDTCIKGVRNRLTKAERSSEGKIVAGRLYDDLISEIESLLDQNEIRRPALSEKLGLTLIELTHLEEDIFQLRKRQRAEAVQPKPEILESIQFQEVVLQANEKAPVPEAPVFPDSRTWIRIISMTGLKVEVNSIAEALEILKIVLQAHRKPDS